MQKSYFDKYFYVLFVSLMFLGECITDQRELHKINMTPKTPFIYLCKIKIVQI